MSFKNDRIKVERKKIIGVLFLNKPEMKNVLDTGTLQELVDTLKALGSDEEIRVVIITSEKDFSAGADIREMKGKSMEEAEAFSRLGHSVCNMIEHMEKPVIAAVKGYTLGGGCEIAMACDIRIAGESARFGQPEINLGLISGFGATQRLTRLVGAGKAMEMILTGRIIEAGEAAFIGLVNKVVRDEALLEEAEDIALTIAQKSPVAVKLAKRLIYASLDIERGLEREIASFSECFAHRDSIEGMNAFLEKRVPRFG